MSLEARFAAAMTRLLAGSEPERLAVAVSGGSDSLALLGLACEWAGDSCEIHALTVDHGLRPDAAEEAKIVTREAVRMGARHKILKWEGWDGRGNLQSEARNARYRLIEDYCLDNQIEAVLVAHTRDDQAETVLMRLARGSGVDGLAAIREGRFGQGRVLRPVLNETRQDLRVWLSRQGMTWTEDPTNDDTRFDRVRARRILEHLDPLGLDAERLAETAAAMARAQEALRARAFDLAQEIVIDHCGILIFDADALASIEEETRLRLVAHGLKCLSGEIYRPRLSSLTSTLEKALLGHGGTLQGCRLIPSGRRLFLVRELKAVERLECPTGQNSAWDNRWDITVTDRPTTSIRALGHEGLNLIERPPEFPHAAWLSYPGVWQGQELLAVPGVLNDNLIQARYLASAAYHSTLLSH